MQAFWIILAIVALLAVIEWFVQRKTISIIRPIFETSPTFNVESFDADPTAESVRFRTSDGLELAGAIHRHKDLEPKGLVLFLHEFGSTHRSAMSYCEALWNAGFDIFAFDIRNHGDSESLANYKPLHWLTHYEVADALAAVDYIQSRDDLKNLPLGVFGISKGGGAALAIAAVWSSILRRSALLTRTSGSTFTTLYKSTSSPVVTVVFLPSPPARVVA